MTVTLLLVVINVLISWQAFQRPGMMDKLKHWPYQEKKGSEYFRLLSGMFLHGDYIHLALNMYALYSFGTLVEDQFVSLFGAAGGRIFYLLLYLLAGLFANLMTYHKHQDHSGFASVGASGAVSGVMFAFVIFYPWVKLLLFYIIPIPGVIASILFLLYSSYAARKGHGYIDHTAHFWGAVFGFVFTILLKPALFQFFIKQISSGISF